MTTTIDTTETSDIVEATPPVGTTAGRFSPAYLFKTYGGLVGIALVAAVAFGIGRLVVRREAAAGD